MCYSAMVKQHVKQIGLTYSARVQLDMFEELFEDRLQGLTAAIPREMELSFKDPANAQEKRIWNLIERWEDSAVRLKQTEIAFQTARLQKAMKTLETKETKKARDEVRIASTKIKKFEEDIVRLQGLDYGEFARIFPFTYAPMIVFQGGERVVRPFRFRLLPAGETSDFDKSKYDTFNARRDRLKEANWWRAVYGRNHGAMILKKFWERVDPDVYQGKSPNPQTARIEIEFEPQDQSELLVPCIYDQNRSNDFLLNSFALITDEPNPEVLAAGHDRSPIFMKEEHLNTWLKTDGKDDLSQYEVVFRDKRKTFFVHRKIG